MLSLNTFTAPGCLDLVNRGEPLAIELTVAGRVPL